MANTNLIAMGQASIRGSSWPEGKASIRVLDVRFLVISLVVMCLTAASLFGIHKFQIARTASVFLRRSEQLERDSNWLGAAEYINRYLQFVPSSGHERAHLARVYAKGISTPLQREKAIELFYLAIGAESAEDEVGLRRQLGGLLLEAGRYAEARTQAEGLLSISPYDAAGLRMKALALIGQYKNGALAHEGRSKTRVIEALAQACKANAGDLDLTDLLARAYLDDKLTQREIPGLSAAVRLERADACMEELLKARPNDAQAFLVRYRFRISQNAHSNAQAQTNAAKGDLGQALKLGPNDLAVLVTAAQAARDEGERASKAGGSSSEFRRHLQVAHDLYKRIVDENLAPSSPLPLLALGEVLVGLGKEDEAITTWKAGLAAFRDSPGVFHTHLADLWLELGKLHEAEKSILWIDKEIESLRSRLSREDRLLMERDQALRRGIWQLKDGKSGAAVPLLQQVVLRQEQLGGSSRQSIRACLLLGSAFGNLSQWENSAAAYDRAASLEPKLASARIEASSSWLAANRPYFAVDRAEQAVNLDSSSKAWLALASACFQQQLNLADGDRVWGRFEQAISNAANKSGDGSLDEPWRVDLLEADYLAAVGSPSSSVSGGQQRVIDTLRGAEAKYPSSTRFWQSIALIYQRLGLPNDADRCIAHLNSFPSPGKDALLTKVRVLALRGEFDLAEKALSGFSRESTQVEPTDLQREFINLKLARRDLAAARKMLEQFILRFPNDLPTLRILADIDLPERRFAELARWESAMRACGGTGETLALYFKISRLVLQASSATDQLLVEAASEQAKLMNRCPNWPEAVALRGIIDQRRGRYDSAISFFEQAIELGEQRLLIFEQLITLLERAHRPADAEKYLSRMKSYTSFSHDQNIFTSTVEVRRNQPERAIEVARLVVQRRPKDASAHLWLGRVLLMNNHFTQAEKEFDLAVSLQPDSVLTWNGLFSYYLRSGNKPKGRETLERMKTEAKLTDADRSFVIAQGYELLADHELAVAAYEQATTQAPDNAAVLLRMAHFYLQHRPDKAEECLKKVLKIDPESSVARRTLAAILASRGKEEDWAAVEDLLKPQQFTSDAHEVQDNRLRAVLLIQRGGAKRCRLAAEILEELVAQPDKRLSSDRLMLAHLYEKLARISHDIAATPNAGGRTREQYEALCQMQFVALCADAVPQPSHLVAFVEYLLRREQKAEAGRWLDKYAELLTANLQPSPALVAEYVRLRIAQGNDVEADKWQNVLEQREPIALSTLSGRAWLMSRSGKREQLGGMLEDAAQRLLNKAQDDDQRAAILLEIGNLYAANDLFANSEVWFRRLYKLKPKVIEPLVGVLTKQNRTTDAIQICEESLTREDSAHGAFVVASILANGKANVTETRRAEELISSALERYPQDVRLLFNVATLRVMQGQTEDATLYFRRVVELNPRHVIAINNLATLLSEQPAQRQEALRLIDQAIAISGSEPFLVDTKGTILLLERQPDKAVDFFTVAVDGTGSDPRFRFHLALAYKDLKELEKARHELEEALKQGLEKQILTPTEQRMLAELRSSLALQ